MDPFLGVLKSGPAVFTVRRGEGWEENNKTTLSKSRGVAQPDKFYTSGLPLFSESVAEFRQGNIPDYLQTATEQIITFTNGMAQLNPRIFPHVSGAIQDVLGIVTNCYNKSNQQSEGNSECLGARMRLEEGISVLEKSLAEISATDNIQSEREIKGVLAGARAYSDMCKSCPFL